MKELNSQTKRLLQNFCSVSDHFGTLCIKILLFSFKDYAILLERRNKQKHPSRGVLRKKCSENMQQIYWRTPLTMCDFNKVA